MAEEESDPREVDWHPRHVKNLLGHADAERRMRRAFDSGKMHHAWLISGVKGIGKASLAYRFAAYILSAAESRALDIADDLSIDHNSRTAHWLASRSHPDLFVLERNWDSKTRKLKSELAVDDARRLSEFFGLTAGSGGWRVAIIDAADDLNNASANALLKLIEEPPSKCLLLLVCNQPGRLPRTIRSRCMRIDLSPLSREETFKVLTSLPLDEPPPHEDLEVAAKLAGGSPGRGLELLESTGAKSFAAFQNMGKMTSASLVEFGNRFGSRTSTAEDFEIFFSLLEGWIGSQARKAGLAGRGPAMADAYVAIGHSIQQTNALNLDRRQAVINALSLINEAMKTA
jgi:DNA polymerase-3 subunit delta'